MRDRAREVEVEHARLHPRDPSRLVDLEHPVHLRRDDDDRFVERRRAPGEAGAAAPGDEGPPVPERDVHRGRDLGRVTREAHGRGRSDGDTRVARVQRELEGFGGRTIRPGNGAKVGEELLVCGVRVRDTRDATE